MKTLLPLSLFCLLSLVPWIQKAAPLLPDAPLTENRTLTPVPTWPDAKGLRGYLMGYQGWFNDHYPLRNLLIRTKTQIDYSVFSYSDRVYIGKDGFLFYRSVLDVNKPKMQGDSKQVYDNYVAAFQRLSDFAKSQGIQLVVFDNELKDEFYPEKLPPGAPRRPSPNGYHAFRKAMLETSGVIFLDSTKLLKDVMPSRPVFHKTDFHWNDPAAREMAKYLVEKLGQLSKQPEVEWTVPFVFKKEVISGGEASFMPLLRPAQEEAYMIVDSQPDTQGAYEFKKEPWEFIYRRAVPSPKLLPTTVIFGDSFCDGMFRSGFCRHFQNLYRARLFHCTLPDVLNNMPEETRIIVIQFNEQNLGFFAAAIDYSQIKK